MWQIHPCKPGQNFSCKWKLKSFQLTETLGWPDCCWHVFVSYKLPLGLGFTTKWLQSLEMLLKYLYNLADTVNIDERNFNRWIHLVRKINWQWGMKFKWDGEIHQVDRRTSVPKPAKLSTLSKKLQYTCFPVNFADFFRTTFLQNF